MYIVAIAWMYVVLMMSVAEAFSPTGTGLGAVITFVLYGLAPLSVVMYLLGTPARKAARLRDEAGQPAAATQMSTSPDGGRHATGEAVAPEREEP